LAWAHELKEKRVIVKSLLKEKRNKFQEFTKALLSSYIDNK